METKKRKFSIPYNGIEANNYLSMIKHYADYIDSVYLGIPLLCNSHASAKYFMSRHRVPDAEYVKSILLYNENCKRFLLNSRGMYKRMITLNSGFYHFTKTEMQLFVIDQLGNLIKNYGVDGFIVTDFNMASFIHKCFPDVELHTSCNCFQWNIRNMKLWRDIAGISVFNPPREILRTLSVLRTMHDEGFKIKCLVNESCLYGCPQTINHCMYLADSNPLFATNCNRKDPANIFRSNWVIPRWLEVLDPYVDVYKISGRNSSIEYIIRTLRAYVEGNDDMNLLDLLLGGTSVSVSRLTPRPNIPLREIPDRLLYCECKECDKGCTVCADLYDKFCV